MINGQDAYPLIRLLEYKNSGSYSPCSVKVPLGWTESGPLPSSEKTQCTFSSSRSQQNKDLAAAMKK